MDPEEIKQLIAYHQAGLATWGQHMNPSAQRLEEQTIKALKELLQNKNKESK